MHDKIGRTDLRVLSRSQDLLEKLGGVSLSLLASFGSDITLVISPDGVIEDVAFRNPSLKNYGADKWFGRHWKDTVTPESVEKILALFEEAARQPITRRRQVNHSAPGLPDLPIDYAMITVEGMSSKIAIGNDLQRFAELQRQLIESQLELENEYRKIRGTESRYRTIFQTSEQPMLIVDGPERKIIDANRAAARLFRRQLQKIINEPAANLLGQSANKPVIDSLIESQHSGESRQVKVCIPDTSEEVLASVEPYRETGRNNLLIRFIRDTRSETEKQSGFAFADAMIEALPETFVTTDGKGIILDVNDRFLDDVGLLNKDRVIGHNLNNWLGASTVDMQVLLSRVKEEGQVQNFSTIVRDEYDDSRPVFVTAANVPTGNGIERIGFLICNTGWMEKAVPYPTRDGGRTSSDFAELVGRVSLKELIREASDVIEKLCIEAALRQTGNNRASAADLLGLSRQSLYIKLKRHGLEDYRGTDS